MAHIYEVKRNTSKPSPVSPFTDRKVMIEGLKERTDCNGVVGRVLRLRPDEEYLVLLSNGEKVQVHASKLRYLEEDIFEHLLRVTPCPWCPCCLCAIPCYCWFRRRHPHLESKHHKPLDHNLDRVHLGSMKRIIYSFNYLKTCCWQYVLPDYRNGNDHHIFDLSITDDGIFVREQVPEFCCCFAKTHNRLVAGFSEPFAPVVDDMFHFHLEDSDGEKDEDGVKITTTDARINHIYIGPVSMEEFQKLAYHVEQRRRRISAQLPAQRIL